MSNIKDTNETMTQFGQNNVGKLKDKHENMVPYSDVLL